MTTGVAQAIAAAVDALGFRQYICHACGLVYDERKGDPDSGLAPGTRFEDIPEDWSCPLCGVTKADFTLRVSAPLAAQTTGAPRVTAGRRSTPGIVIVGAGHAGWQMARALRQRDAEVPVTVVTRCTGDVYDKPLLSVAFAKSLNGPSLVKEPGAEAARRLGVRLLTGTHAISILSDGNLLRTTRGPLEYRHLVLAHGAVPRSDPVLPANLCWTINDLSAYTCFRTAVDATGRRQRVAVIGGGLVGCELANDLVIGGHAVVLVEASTRPLAKVLPPEGSAALLTAWGTLDLRFFGGTRVVAAARQSDGVRLTTDDGRTHEVDHVVSALGLTTPSRLADTAGLAWNNGIAVHRDTLRTSIDNIHAIGDCVSVDGEALRFVEPIGRQAEVIAARVTGGPAVPYRHLRPLIRVKTTTRRFTA